jgi:hypothetical protein
LTSAVIANAEEEALRMKQYEGQKFTLLIPERAKVAKSTPAVDFDLYVVKYENKVLLRVYVGNAPHFPPRGFPSKADKDERQEKAGVVVRSIRRQTTEYFSREVLMDMSKKVPEWPKFIHLWYQALPKKMAAVADTMIESATVKDEIKQ